jgi:hypothetical protein
MKEGANRVKTADGPRVPGRSDSPVSATLTVCALHLSSIEQYTSVLNRFNLMQCTHNMHRTDCVLHIVVYTSTQASYTVLA